MATIKVILQASAKDRSVGKWLKGSTKLANEFTAATDRARASLSKLGKAGLGAAIGAGAAPGGRGGKPRGGGSRGGRGGVPTIDRALASAQRSRASSAKREAKLIDRRISMMGKASQREARVDQRRLKAATRAAKNIENLSDAQVQEIETQREINNRRSRAARSAAKQKLGPDKTPRAGGSMRRFENAENLASAAGEFERVADKIDQGVRASNSSFRDFQKGIAEIDTLGADITIQEIEEATKAAALAFGTLPTEQTAAFYAVVSAGATDAAGATAQLTAANQLAVGGVASTEEAVLAISKGLANFADQGETAASVADKLFGAVQLGQVTVSEMAIALPKVAQTASAAGLSLSETNAALAILSKQSGSAKLGATNLDEALRQLIAPTAKADEVIAKLSARLKKADKDSEGIGFGAAGVKAAGGFEGFLKLVKSAGATDKDLKQIFGGSGFKAIRGLTVSLADAEKGFAATERAIDDSEGLGLKANNKLMETAAKRADVLDAKMELLKVQVGEGLLPVMEGLHDAVGPVITSLTSMIKENPRTAKTVGALALGVLALTRVVGGVATAMSLYNTVAGISAAKTAALGTSAATTSTSMTRYGKAVTGMKGALGAVPAVAAGAAIAILAFNTVLDQAQKPLARFEDTLTRIAEKQQDISFEIGGEDKQAIDDLTTQRDLVAAELEKTKNKKKQVALTAELLALNKQIVQATEGADARKTKELDRERLNRQIQITNAATQAAFESKGGGLEEALSSGNIGDALSLTVGGGLNRATGVSDDLQRVADQSNRDLAALASQLQQEGSLSVSEAEQFAVPGGDSSGDAIQDLIDAMRQVATNTTPSTGPSMEAGLA